MNLLRRVLCSRSKLNNFYFIFKPFGSHLAVVCFFYVDPAATPPGLVIFQPGFEVDTYGWGWNTPSAGFKLNDDYSCWVTFLVSGRRLVGHVEQGSEISRVTSPIAYSALGLKTSNKHLEKEECTNWYDMDKKLCRTKEITHFYKNIISIREDIQMPEIAIGCESAPKQMLEPLDPQAAWNLLKTTPHPFIKFQD